MKMQLKIMDKSGKTVVDTRTTRKRRILYFIQAEKTQNAHFFIRVTYSDGFSNRGEYLSKNDALLAFHAFAEDQP